MMKKKHDLKEELSKTLNETVNLVITTCIASELKSLESVIPGITNYALRYKLHECNHKFTPDKCILSMIGNKNKKKYMLASQDIQLRKRIRASIPGVPLIFFDQNMILIEKPSDKSIIAFDKRESLKQEPTLDEKKGLTVEKVEINQYMKDEYMKSRHFQRRLEEQKLQRMNGLRTKKAKGPNPLSCMKRKRVKLGWRKDEKGSKGKTLKEKRNRKIEGDKNEGKSNIEANDDSLNEVKPRRQRKRNKLKRYTQRIQKRENKKILRMQKEIEEDNSKNMEMNEEP
eukprot:CAMPEP_0170518246 /NCGR_PEP_ID=MMETSP0209-20121228/3976_1 /TAXON_ID=665100 ORGANISM="Litonotus pictus, Strain P1" /NCGR_SAMPLE_ID=MMETSP0209 /ASSEMBLY_ACC=CAM_ASM_000301 /LENGTH=284 /DNA_ID=CAMNT_0010803723 /DNA_START=105 /DNA_END=959 /DNA_ORIENTATION=+